MYKIDSVKRLFDCDLCSETLVEPITLPCGNSICKSHLEETQEFSCELCGSEHPIPSGGFGINKRLKMGLDIELNTLSLDPNFYACKERLEKVGVVVALAVAHG